MLPVAELCSAAPTAEGCAAPEQAVERESRLAADAVNDTSEKLAKPAEPVLAATNKEGDPANVRLKTYCN